MAYLKVINWNDTQRAHASAKSKQWMKMHLSCVTVVTNPPNNQELRLVPLFLVQSQKYIYMTVNPLMHTRSLLYLHVLR